MTEAERKQKWIDALRSGEYQQTRCTMKDDKGYCCLGVYMDAVLNKPINCNTDNTTYDIFSGEKVTKLDVDIGVYRMLDNSINPTVTDKGIGMNDEGKSFLEIADMIEEEWVID